MIPKNLEHYFYYIYLIFGIMISVLVPITLNYLFVAFYFNGNMFSMGYVAYTYTVISTPLWNSITLYVDLFNFIIFIFLFKYFLAKNKYKRIITYSRFATSRDIKLMDDPSVLDSDGFALGNYRGRILKTNKPLGYLCVAPAGAGKTSGIVIPCILEANKDSLIINDPKGELYRITHKYRRQKGKVYRLEWGQSKEKQDKYTTKWNPLSLDNMKKGTPERSKYVELIVNILISKSGSDPFWSNSARKTLAAVMLFLIYKKELDNKDTTITECKNLLATIGVLTEEEEEELEGKDPIKYGFKKLMLEVNGLDIPLTIKERCYMVFAELSATSPNTLGSILATISADLSIFNNENVIEVTSSNNFLMSELRGQITLSGKKKIHSPITVYLISPAAEQELFGVLSAIFVETAYKYITSEDEQEIQQKNTVRFLLDEVAFFPKISATIDAPAISRGYKGSFLFVCQDLGQIKEKFGENGLNTMLTNSAFKVILPQNNYDTAKRFAELAGVTKIIEWENAPNGKRIRRKKEKPLINPSDVLHMPTGKQIVYVQNSYKTPIMCDIPFYFKDMIMLKKLKQAEKWYAQQIKKENKEKTL